MRVSKTPQREPVGIIHGEDTNRDSPDWGQPLDASADAAEVIGPDFVAGVEEHNDRPRFGIDPGQIRPFMKATSWRCGRIVASVHTNPISRRRRARFVEGDLMRYPRGTTRRWMATVAVVAMLMAALIEGEKSWSRHSRYASVLRAFRRHEVFYDEGRVTLERYIMISRHLMEAELDLCWMKGAKITAIEAHLNRVSLRIDEEINLPWSLHDTDYERAPGIAAAKESLIECRARLNDLIHRR